MPPKHTQHMQPAFMQLLTQSQQACNISQQALSPDVQVMQTPSLVISHLQLHMAKLHWHMTMPFIMQQQLHMPLASMRQMFCKVPHDTSSSHDAGHLDAAGALLHLHLALRNHGHRCPCPGPWRAFRTWASMRWPSPTSTSGRSTIIMDIADSFQIKERPAKLQGGNPPRSLHRPATRPRSSGLPSRITRRSLIEPPARRVGFSGYCCQKCSQPAKYPQVFFPKRLKPTHPHQLGEQCGFLRWRMPASIAAGLPFQGASCRCANSAR